MSYNVAICTQPIPVSDQEDARCPQNHKNQQKTNSSHKAPPANTLTGNTKPFYARNVSSGCLARPLGSRSVSGYRAMVNFALTTSGSHPRDALNS
jgi:hypothetical protein